MDFNSLQVRAWQIAEAHGLHDTLRGMPLREATLIRLALVHTEVSEVTQAVKRHGVTPATLDAITHEAADTIIWLADMLYDIGQRLGVPMDMNAMLRDVCAANARRPYRYGTPEEVRCTPRSIP